MLFRKKIDRVIDVNAIEEKNKAEPREELEKGDLLAIFIAAALVFIPILIGFIGVVYLILWFFVR